MSDTIFTKIINKEIPADILYEDELAMAFSDINPQAPIHFLVIPKKPITTMNDIQEEDKALVGHLHWVAAKLAKKHGIAEEGYGAVTNCNINGGQTVYYIHLQVLAAKAICCPPH